MQLTHGFWRMFSTLFGREWVNYKRNPMKITRLIINYIIMAGMICLVFFNSVSTTAEIEAVAASSPPSLVLQNIIQRFIQSQSSCYINVMSAIMVSILFVALGRKPSPI